MVSVEEPAEALARRVDQVGAELQSSFQGPDRVALRGRFHAEVRSVGKQNVSPGGGLQTVVAGSIPVASNTFLARRSSPNLLRVSSPHKKLDGEEVLMPSW